MKAWILCFALFAGTTGCFTPMAQTAASPGSPAAALPGKPIDRATLVRLDPVAVMYLDVRNAREFAYGHLPGAIHVSVTDVSARVEEIRILGNGRPIVVYCNSGKRSEEAIRLLADAGLLDTRHLTGDYFGWVAAGLPIETETLPEPDSDRWF